MRVFLSWNTKIILGIFTVIFGLVTVWCIYIYLKKLCLQKFGTSKEVRQLMRKYDMSRSEAKTHRLQLHQTHQTAIKIKAKERRKDLDKPKRKAAIKVSTSSQKGGMIETEV